MRPGQNKRMRGRNNSGGGGGGNHRKGPNPLTRSYESNGPDVKIRGTAHHVGEKYLQLARDAQSSGDPVMAESYLQHAEHYFRLIAAAQQAQAQAAYGYQRPAGEQAEPEDDGEDDDFSSLPDRFASPTERVVTPPPQPAPQPYAERPAYNGGERGAYEPRQERSDRERYDRANQGGDRQGQDRQGQDRQGQDRSFQNRSGQDRSGQDRNGQDRNGQDRAPQQDRAFGDRQPQQGERYERQERPNRQAYGERPFNRPERPERPAYPDRQERPVAAEGTAPDRNGQGRDFDNRGQRNGNRPNREFRDQPREYREPRPVEAEPSASALPAFITAPVRAQPEPEVETQAPVTEAPLDMTEAPTSDDGGFALRPRRRRRTKAEFAETGGEAQAAPDPIGD